MYKLEIEGEFIPVNFSTTIRKRNPYLTLSLVGEYTFQFALPVTDITRKVFGNVNNPAILITKAKSFPARLWSDNHLIFEGYCNLKKALKTTYSVELSKTPGNINKSVYDTKLNTLDLGSHNFNTQIVTTGLWTIKSGDVANEVALTFKEVFNYANIILTVQIDTVTIFELVFNRIVNPTIDKLVDQFNSAIDSYNEKSDRLAELIYQNQSLNFIFNDTNNHAISLKIEMYSERERIRNRYRTFTASQLQYEAIVQDELDNSQEFKYLPIKNDSAYESGWGGIINVVELGTLLQNNYIERTKYAISPCFNVLSILKKVCTILGYQVISDLDNHPDYKDMYLISTRNQDKQATTDIALNIYNPAVVYADYMPAWTIKEFLEACKISFQIGLDFDEENKTVELSAIDSKLQQDSAIDISRIVNPNMINNMITSKVYQLKYADTEDYDKYQPYPSDDTLKDKTIEPIEVKFTPAMLESELKAIDNPNYLHDPQQQDYIVINTPVQSPVFSQHTNTLQHRVCFYKSVTADLVMITNDGIKASLALTGDKGLYSKLSTLFAALQSAQEFETTIVLNPLTAKSDITKLYQVSNVQMLIYEIEIRIPMSELSTIRFWRT